MVRATPRYPTRCVPFDYIIRPTIRQTNAAIFFPSQVDARWNAEREAVELGVEVGEYRGVVRVPGRVFQRLPRIGSMPHQRL
jgi:hypothetical protein